MGDRKKEHIDLVFKSQTGVTLRDNRFIYEPAITAHPSGKPKPFIFLGKTLQVPIWVSSMTGGTRLAKTINENIARTCRDFGMGMGLGSCRSLLDDDTSLGDFDVRKYIGDNLPLMANLGIAQVEKLIATKQAEKINILIDKLNADGLIIHINPLQEWFQPEGNTIKHPPVETIKKTLELFSFPVVVKEVGQGMGPESIKQLLQLPIKALEFGAYGGTNFSLTELIRNKGQDIDVFSPFTLIGHTAEEMLNIINSYVENTSLKCNELIISGGIHNFLDGFYLMKKSKLPSIYGQASEILRYAMKGYEELHNYIEKQVKGLLLAGKYLKINPERL